MCVCTAVKLVQVTIAQWEVHKVSFSQGSSLTACGKKMFYKKVHKVGFCNDHFIRGERYKPSGKTMSGRVNYNVMLKG